MSMLAVAAIYVVSALFLVGIQVALIWLGWVAWAVVSGVLCALCIHAGSVAIGRWSRELNTRKGIY